MNYIESVKGLHGSAGRANACIPKRNLIGKHQKCLFLIRQHSALRFTPLSPESRWRTEAGNAPLPAQTRLPSACACRGSEPCSASRSRALPGERGEAAPRFGLITAPAVPADGLSDLGQGEMTRAAATILCPPRPARSLPL